MQIRKLNPAENPQDLAAVIPAVAQWHVDYQSDLPRPGKVRLRHWGLTGYQSRTLVFGVFADEHATEADGFVAYGYETEKNLDLAWADNFCVTAQGRARGAETALFEALIRQNAELGRKRLAIGLPETMAPAPFLEQYGGTITDTALMSTLDLGAVDLAQYEAWAEPSEKNSEYTLVGWVGRCPDELAESFCTARDAMADQPLGTFEYTWEKYSLERLRFGEELMENVGVRRYVQAALDPEGNVAGFHVIGAYPDEPDHVEIFDTGVSRNHRGHGLGLRVKAAASLWILEDRPSTRLVTTFNNDENQWMLAVNRAMGYRSRCAWPGYEFTVTV
jgi:GNAT superfamily N-acetyltransferase